MDLFHRLKNKDFLESFCEILENLISLKKGHDVIISHKENSDSIFFFIDGSSILQIMPDKDLQYTYAHVPSYDVEIKNAINIATKQNSRHEKINKILKEDD